jgi:hypothetical protein
MIRPGLFLKQISTFSKNGSEKFEKILNLCYNLAAIWGIPTKKFEHFKGTIVHLSTLKWSLS